MKLLLEGSDHDYPVSRQSEKIANACICQYAAELCDAVHDMAVPGNEECIRTYRHRAFGCESAACEEHADRGKENRDKEQ